MVEMTQEQILQEFEALPLAQQEELARTMSERLKRRVGHSAMPGNFLNGERIARRRAALKRLRGALQWPTQPPTDQQIKQLREDYLTEKYG